MASTMTPAAPVTPAVRGRAGHPALVGTLALVAAGAMLLAGLGGAYLSVRNANRADFVPEDMAFNNYTAFMILVTAGLASMGAEWAMASVKNAQRRYATMGWALAVAMGVAALNGVWFLGRGLQLAVADSPYATIVYALFTAAGLLIGLAILAAVVGGVRTLGGQISPERPYIGRAAAWVVHLATLGWLVTYALVYLYK